MFTSVVFLQAAIVQGQTSVHNQQPPAKRMKLMPTGGMNGSGMGPGVDYQVNIIFNRYLILLYSFVSMALLEVITHVGKHSQELHSVHCNYDNFCSNCEEKCVII